MLFKKYNSIENTYRKEFLEKIKNHGFWRQTFVVQEKVHGANFSLWMENGQLTHAAKRTSILTATDAFYNHEGIIENFRSRMETLWKEVAELIPNLTSLAVYGELMGGSYSHPEVEKVQGAKKVQKGIDYCPHNDFFAFDIRINDEQYLDVDTANKLFESLGFVYAKTLFQGSLEEALEYPNAFQSTIYKAFDLPVLEDNICEGVVIRPVQALYFNNGVRVILKNKNEKWTEKAQRKRGKKIEQSEALKPEVIELQEELATYLSKNRLSNVISKIGEVTSKEFGLVMKAFTADALEDFEKDFQEKIKVLEKSDYKHITKSMGKQATKLVRERLIYGE